MSAENERAVERVIQTRELISVLMGLFKAVGLYDWHHNAVYSAAERVQQAVRQIADEGELELVVRRGSIFVDGMRIREATFGGSSYHRLIELFRAAQIGSLRVDADVERDEVEVFGRLTLAASQGQMSPEAMMADLANRALAHLQVDLIEEDKDEEVADDLDSRRVCKGVYLRSIGVLKGVFHEARVKDRINMRRVKRVVRQMIESVETDQSAMLSLASVRNYDEYTFNHSVNVSVLAIALGRAVGLSERQLYRIGQAGMLHDLGKLCVSKEILNKPGRLTPEERRLVQSHPCEGFMSIVGKQGVSVDTVSVALAAYEHHVNLDGSGYPDGATKRPVGLLSRLVAIVDRYDAMTSARVYRGAPIPPPKTLAILYHSQRGQVDQALLRYFMNMLGYYPLGTTVRLSDNSVAIVTGSAADDRLRHFPSVNLVLDRDGRPAEGDAFDLSATAKEDEALRVIETLNAADYGIEVMDYIL
jgi:HD-GYP domain-containing protein (c-di-GMP phosphodiesterase class II)